MAEARLHPRLRINARVDLIGREVVLGRSLEDLSLGGLRLTGPGWENQGTDVQMVLSFPTLGAHLPLSGVIVRSNKRDLGVRFSGLSDEQKWSLRKHVRELQKKGG